MIQFLGNTAGALPQTREEEDRLNTIRNLFPQEVEALKPLLRAAYQAILDYQHEREQAREANMRAAIRRTLPILKTFKPHIPRYKGTYIELLENDEQLAPYDLIICFDRAIYELHARVKCGEWSHLPWSKNLRNLLNERQHVEALPTAVQEETFLVSGRGVTRGSVVGPARMVISTGDFSKVQKGDILITPMADPDFIHVAKLIAGLVTDRGGVLCHAAILARELNLPCIIGCEHATQTIGDGQWIRLDAASGIVMGIEH
jgi:phosphohistidine swiveling domain-containing protein